LRFTATMLCNASTLRERPCDYYARTRAKDRFFYSDKFGHGNCVNLRDSARALISHFAVYRSFTHAITAELRNDAKFLKWVRLPYALRYNFVLRRP
jgi:hypothetical protein